MSHPRLHQLLSLLYDQRNPSLIAACLNHEDYQNFIGKHGLKLSVSDLAIAFTHTSFSHEYEAPHQENLEFLGDSVLQMILTHELYQRFPTEKEGRLSKLRSSLVNEKVLAVIARSLNLNDLILVGKGEFKKELYNQDPVLADTFEALLGKIYLHQGLDATRDLFFGWLKNAVPDAFDFELLKSFDAKSKLQEASLAKYKKLPRYDSSPAGDGFLIEIFVNDHKLASGIFSSKKSGEKELAEQILKSGSI